MGDLLLREHLQMAGNVEQFPQTLGGDDAFATAFRWFAEGDFAPIELNA
ncbi:hypothetical protein [Verrucomicrobium spinosum]|nr:hypothetical protein [Verrucomicrobium spinosum]